MGDVGLLFLLWDADDDELLVLIVFIEGERGGEVGVVAKFRLAFDL